MEQPKPTINLWIIEDNEFYIQLLRTRLSNYLYPICNDLNMELNIASFTNANNARANYHNKIDIVFLDYYLGNDVTGLEIMKELLKRSPNAHIIIMSQVKSLNTSLVTLLDGAKEFIHKDKNAITKSCFSAEEFIRKKVKPIVTNGNSN